MRTVIYTLRNGNIEYAASEEVFASMCDKHRKGAFNVVRYENTKEVERAEPRKANVVEVPNTVERVEPAPARRRRGEPKEVTTGPAPEATTDETNAQ